MQDLKKAAERLIWRLKPNKNGGFKSFTPNQNDIDCLNCILNWINNQKKETLNNNHLFAKLYIYVLTQEINFHDTNVLDSIPQKKVSALLNHPLDKFYKSFTNDLYENQLKRLLRLTESEEQRKVISEYQEQKNLYPEGLIESQLNHMITEALNRFN